MIRVIGPALALGCMMTRCRCCVEPGTASAGWRRRAIAGRQRGDLLVRKHALHRDQHAAGREQPPAPRRRTWRGPRTRARSRRRTAPPARSPRRAPRRRSTLASPSSSIACADERDLLARCCRAASPRQSGRAMASGRPGNAARRSRRRAAARPARRQVRQHGERVEQMVGDHLRRLADGRQVVRAVPLGEQRDQGGELRRAPGGRASPSARTPSSIAASIGAALPPCCAAPVFALGATRRAHADRRPAAPSAPGGAAPSVAVDAAGKPRFRCTSSSAIAAGVTPEMRAAWPTVSGRCWLSFCCTSVERPRTVR